VRKRRPPTVVLPQGCAADAGIAPIARATGGRGDDRKGRRCVAGQGDKAWLRDHRGRLEAREGRGGDRESVQAAERSYVERTAPKKKELTKEHSSRQRPRHARIRRPGRRRAGRRRQASAPRARPSARSPRARSCARTSSTWWPGCGLQPRRRAARPGPKSGSNTSCPRRGTTGIDAAPARCKTDRGDDGRSRTSWPGAARLMRHAATKWSCT